jgi:hypothetical protein
VSDAGGHDVTFLARATAVALGGSARASVRVR